MTAMDGEVDRALDALVDPAVVRDVTYVAEVGEPSVGMLPPRALGPGAAGAGRAGWCRPDSGAGAHRGLSC